MINGIREKIPERRSVFSFNCSNIVGILLAGVGTVATGLVVTFAAAFIGKADEALEALARLPAWQEHYEAQLDVLDVRLAEMENWRMVTVSPRINEGGCNRQTCDSLDKRINLLERRSAQ